MARRPPGVVRAQRGHARREQGSSQIPGLSSRSAAAIACLPPRLEAGAVTAAFSAYRRTVTGPGRWLDLQVNDCPCCSCDPVEQRDVLEEAMRLLPPIPARELRGLVAVLDQQFLRKTLPDPLAAGSGDWPADGWWRRRLHER